MAPVRLGYAQDPVHRLLHLRIETRCGDAAMESDTNPSTPMRQTIPDEAADELQLLYAQLLHTDDLR